MIWINISNILKITKFSGIARTEYELCLYAYELKKQGHNIGFSTYDVCVGFKSIEEKYLEDVLYKLKNNQIEYPPKLKPWPKLRRSILKRLNLLKVFCNIMTHPYQQGDVIISVGQDMQSGEMWAYRAVKSQVKVKLNLLCHDLIPINYPQFFPDENVNLFARYMKQVMQVVDQFYCNSEFTKQELIEYHHRIALDVKPMQVITLGCDLHSKKLISNHSAQIQELVKQKYVLFVSTIEIRKNHQLLYEMYLELLNDNIQDLPKICFVGKRGWKVDELLQLIDRDERIKDKILILDNVCDADLIYLYQNCWFTVYPSLMEGYGLPVAESLSFGKYCLASHAGSLPEVGGGFIDYANPNNLQEWTEKFKFLINNPHIIQSKEALIQQNYKHMSWKNCVKQILSTELKI